MSKLPISAERIVLTHFIVSGDVERSRHFFTEALGGETIRSGVGCLQPDHSHLGVSGDTLLERKRLSEQDHPRTG